MHKLKIQRNLLLVAVLISLFAHLIFGLEGMRQVAAYEYQIHRQAAQLKDKQEQIELLEIILENQKTETDVIEESEYIGTFTITHYCPCETCCGKTDGITYTGTKAVEGRTIAVDPEVIPLGSTVIIDGQAYIAEDIGGAIKGNRLDVYMDSHQAALKAGVVQAEVYIGG